MNKRKTLLFAACCLLCGAAMQAQEVKDWANFGRYEMANKEVKNPKVVFMGNSITDGWPGADPEFFTQNNYVGRGIGGQVSAQMLLRFRPDVIDLKPQAVVILAGTNDVALNDYAMTPDHTFDNIVSMAELARANGIKVVLCSTMPASKFGWRPEVEKPAGTIKALNARVKAYAEKNGFVYVDYHSALADAEGGLPAKYSKDGVHPTLEGYKVMEKLVQEGIRKALE